MTTASEAMTPAAPPFRRAPHVQLVEIGGLWVHASIPAMYQQRVAEWPHDLVEFRKVAGEWRGTSAAQSARRVQQLALGLLGLAVRKGDRVGLVAETRPEWGRVDLAILHLGAVTVGVYPTLPADESAWILDHAECRVVVVEDEEQLEKVRAERERLPRLERVVVIDPPPGPLRDDESTLADLEAAGAAAPGGAARFEAAWRAVGPEDLATIIYTSGTTGQPKGAMLTHGNLSFVVHSASSVLPGEPGDTSVVFLPQAHALQRVASYGGMFRRAAGYFCTSHDKLMEEIREVEPTVQVSVPRIWEKLHARILETVASAPPHRRRMFEWGLDVGRRAAPYLKAGRPLPLRLRVAHAVASRVVHDRLKERVFGRNIRFLTSGAAPISTEILEFFHALGLLVLEGWGLTETAAPATLNRVDDFEFGTVGKAIPGTTVKLADDGELLVRGPGVFRGYFKDPAASTEAFTEDLFFRTGDIGEIDARGFVRITDRKKNLIVLANGKKVAPQKLENHFKNAPLVGNCLIHGDRRSYLVGLLVLDHDEAVRWARRHGLCREEETPGCAALAALPQLRAQVDQDIAALNERLARFEQLKRWELLPETWSPDDGSLTPTLKMKRPVLEARHKARLDAMYAGG